MARNPNGVGSYELDVTELDSAQKYCDEHGLQLEVVQLVGPGGGNPLVRISGPDAALEIMLSDFGYTHEDLADGTVASNADNLLQGQVVRRDLKRGDTVNIKGYDIVATALFNEGGGGWENQAVVLSNNSSHYLLVTRASDSNTAIFRQSFRYDVTLRDIDGPEPNEAYRQALTAMVKLALSR